MLRPGGNVWFTCIPDLWLLARHQGQRQGRRAQVAAPPATASTSASSATTCTGWSWAPTASSTSRIGDRGLNVKTKEGKHLFNPDTGPVLRCDPDGSEPGGRSPPACATRRSWPSTSTATCSPATTTPTAATRPAGCTSSRAATAAGASATSIERRQGSRGPWNAEKIWHPPHDGQPAYIVPPIANLADGPSGLAYYPGTGPAGALQGPLLPRRLPRRHRRQRHPVVRGQAEGRRLRAGRLARVRLERPGHRRRFRPRRRAYVSDWVEGWGKTGKGRLWKITDPKQAKSDGRRRDEKAHGRRVRQAVEREAVEASRPHATCACGRRHSSPWRRNRRTPSSR